MPVTTKRLQERTETVKFEFEGEEVNLTYRRGKCVPVWIENWGFVPVKQMLAQVLWHWDVLGDDDKPYVPMAMGNPQYVELAREVVAERAKAERAAAIERGEAVIPEKTGRGKRAPIAPPEPLQPLTDAELTAIHDAEPTPELLEELYVRAWDAMLSVLQQPFLATALDAIMEDLRPGPKR